MDSLERQALITRIADEVCRAVGAAEKADEERPDTLVLISAPLAVPDRTFADVGKVFGSKVSYLLFGTHLRYSQVKAVRATEENEQDCVETAAAASSLLVLAPGVSTLSMLASEETGGPLEELAMRALLWGKNVHIWLDFQPERFQRNIYFTKLMDAVKALESMGARIRAFDWMAAEGSEPLPSLVTEQDMIDAGNAGAHELHCAARAIITPSALDRARELDIRIVRV